MPRLLVAPALVLLLAATVFAADRRPPRPRPYEHVIYGAVVGTRTEVDTVYVLGGPGRHDGRFEDAAGIPSWNGWTHVDLTDDPNVYWNVSEFMAPSGQYAMWCGTYFADGDPGYGNNWIQNLVFTQIVTEPASSSTVTWTGTLRIDSEPGYDATYVQVNRGGTWQDLQVFDGTGVHTLNETMTHQPGDYVGIDGNEIQLRVRFESDDAWSDQDGLWDTDGACQYDDVSVSVDGELIDFEDFEDQISNHWHHVFEPSVGDFAALYTNLQDLDPCRSNYSTQVAFIDDGIVVPGTGGTPCITWCYGPGGYIVNNTGGLAGPDRYLSNLVMSPVLDWPEGCDAGRSTCDIYRHEELGDMDTWPGVFFQMQVRSTADPVGQPIEIQPWKSDRLVRYGGPDYWRAEVDLARYLEPDPVQVQVALWVVEYGWYWGWVGEDGTPAPYLDNFAVTAWPYAGPHVEILEFHLANDNFPAAGVLDYTDLANNSVRFDMARNISQQDDMFNNPGDSIVFDVATARSGSQIVDPPRVFVRMSANPLFDAVRTLPPGFTQGGNIIDGVVDADTTYWLGNPIGWTRFEVDLPDEGFFYPGDVIHYFIEVRDDRNGNVGVTILPPDTAGFASFVPDLRYDSNFVVRALPTMFSATPGDQPRILFWNDFGAGDGKSAWHHALRHCGLEAGTGYDMYMSTAATASVGQGLGGRATAAVIDEYDVLLYSSGIRTYDVLGDGTASHGMSEDIQLLSAWFASGGKSALMVGANLVSSNLDDSQLKAAFVSDYFDVQLIDPTLAPLISNQTAPRVVTVAGNGIFETIDAWNAVIRCPLYTRVDAIVAGLSSFRLATFSDPGGNPDAYPYAAAIYHHRHDQNADVVMLPYDLMSVHAAPGWTPPHGNPLPARAAVLGDVLRFFDINLPSPVAATPDAPLRVTHYPNPFNPVTTIALDLPRAGVATLKIYDLRGALVRTLVDERLAAGHHEIEWNGTDNRGAAVASGVYFSETRAAGEVMVHKLALVK